MQKFFSLELVTTQLTSKYVFYYAIKSRDGLFPSQEKYFIIILLTILFLLLIQFLFLILFLFIILFTIYFQMQWSRVSANSEAARPSGNFGSPESLSSIILIFLIIMIIIIFMLTMTMILSRQKKHKARDKCL